MSPSVNSQSAATQAKPAEASSVSDLHFDLSQPISTDRMANSATELMELLFADVDRMLEQGVPLELPETSPELPNAAVPAENEARVPTATTMATMETLLSPQFAALASHLPPKLSPRDLVPSSEPVEEPPPAAESPESVPVPVKPGSSIWLMTLCGSLLLSLGILSFLYRTQVSGLWLTLLEKYRPAPVTVVSASPSPAGSSAGSSAAESPAEHADFLTYLQRALERLSHHAALPPSPAAPPATGSPLPTSIERVYVPIYPTSPAPAQAPAAAPTAQGAAKPLPTLHPSPQPAAVAPSVAAVPNIGSETSHTLIGVLELGERSAALFEVNGTPKRIEVGEQVGSSGWTLVSISNQEAIVRRNGEVRSIYVGQKF